MWRILIPCFLAAVMALGVSAAAQELRRPYGPFDAIAEGSQRGEAQRLSLIQSQLDTVDQLRLARVSGPRTFLRDPNVAAVYPYGRRGIFGLRPRGYIVVRRGPIPDYRNEYAPVPPDLGGYGAYDDPAPQAVRQPIGHELLRTGPNRWEYRPLYAEDERELDEIHREIEQDLRPLPDERPARRAGYSTPHRRPDASQADTPEELPEPQAPNGDAAISGNDRAAPRRGAIRDVARNGNANPRSRSSVPPPPLPDPDTQPRTLNGGGGPQPPSTPAGDDLIRGPLLQNPSTGAREF
jgi:hypothetical protein